MRVFRVALCMALISCGAETAGLTFQVPEGTAGAVVFLDSDAGVSFEGFTLLPPGADTPFTPRSRYTWRGSRRGGAALLTRGEGDVPNGTWRVVLAPDAGTGPVSIEVVRSTPGASVVNLRFLLVSGCVPDEAGVEALLRAQRDRLDVILSQAGLRVGTITVGSIDASLSCSLENLGLLAFVHPQLRTNDVTFVVTSETITPPDQLGDDFTTLGFAPIGGVPGRPFGVGALHVRDGSDSLVQQVLAHEVGHFLGLEHVVDRDGLEADDLTDTPPCQHPVRPPTRNDCGDAVFFNLMYPLAGSLGVPLVSPSQLNRLTRSPALR